MIVAHSGPVLGLFEGVGIELEYMIVDAEQLDVRPIADWLISEAAGETVNELERDEIAWNNELAAHVLELKSNGPVDDPAGLLGPLQREIAAVNEILTERYARLLPTAMHPWMDPHRELELWPHGQNEIYAAFDRIFSCQGHGWANLQSMHINLPFADDDEFGRLHAAIRFLLPLLPALAASSPYMDGLASGLADNRLAVYRTNCARIPSITGAVVPEPIYTIGEYHDDLLARLYRDIAPFDPEGVLQEEWLNARGAIARFDRHTIEIRLLDVQETPRADLAYASLIIDTLRSLVEERWGSLAELREWPTQTLAGYLDATIERAEATDIGDRRYLRALGYPGGSTNALHVWGHLAEQAAARDVLGADAQRVLDHYLSNGSLARRILRATGNEPNRGRLARVYTRLADCLAAAELF